MRIKFSVGQALIILCVSFFFSCKSAKELAYFKDLSDTAKLSKISSLPYLPLRLQASDEIQVIVSSSSPETSQMFNTISVAPAISPDGTKVVGESQGYQNIYRVSQAGSLTLPVLGDIQASGLTIEELKASISLRLKDYLKNPIVLVSLTNFKVTVIGEVGKPVVVPVRGQTINLLEAIGAAGDLTVFGIRNKVRVIRKLPDGNTEVALLDLNNSAVFQSPYFQLKQNDIVYVQPKTSKSVQGSRAIIWVPIVTAIVYLAAILVSTN